MEKLQKVLTRLCAPSLSWQKRYSENIYERPYINIANLGNEVVHFASNGNKTKDIEAFFRIVEEILVENQADQDLEIYSFIGAGLFESMQSAAYSKLNPPDLLNKFLGENSLEFWGDIIEGWTGKGIRTIDQWKRVLINELPIRIKIEIYDPNLKIDISTTNSQTLPRLLYEKKLQKDNTQIDFGFDKPFAFVNFYFGENKKNEKLILGEIVSEKTKNRFALFRSEIFEINFTKYFDYLLTIN